MANNKEFTISLKTKLADKSGIEELKSLLRSVESSIQAQTIGKGGISAELERARNAASQLDSILTSSWSSKLGQLDLSKFKSGLDKAGLSVKQLKQDLEASGTNGAAAYNHLTKTILNTNVQLKTSSKLLNDMATTFGNTIKWGFSSSVFNTLTSSVQKAYSYSKDLNESLNSIRIVSGKSADDMERFAIQANKAAQSLGATTLDYTGAALIYEQQGLGDAEVQARTETTLKMANVLNESADAVSNYMTAIWNNFAEGATNLEYYGDVITALGAATASSSEEIAAGLEKFASVTETIGLSYEYATSALATVTATTRQSADVVGTAFKTLFSRIQGLSLGETLDDGTTLNKYSEALLAVGINIKDQSGELKDMDDILDEMGAKWNSLSKDQQVALAQTVAGVRQYNQLMSLMNNWDFFQENLDTANNATGTLTEQQGIYMESMEASLNSLRAEIEDTWDILFDEESFTKFVNMFTDGLGLINAGFQGLGGGFQTLTSLGLLAASKMSGTIGGALERRIENRQASESNAAAQQLKQDFITSKISAKEGNSQGLQDQLRISQEILNLSGKLTKEEAIQLTQAQAEIGALNERIEGITSYKDIYIELAKYTKQQLLDEDASFDDYEKQFEIISKQLNDEADQKQGFINKWKMMALDYNQNLADASKKSNKDNLLIQRDLIQSKKDMQKLAGEARRAARTEHDARNLAAPKGTKKATLKEDEVYQKDIERIGKIEQKILENKALTQGEINTLLKTASQEQLGILGKISKIKQATEGLKDAEGDRLPELQAQYDELVKITEEELVQKERQAEISQAVETTTSLFSGLVGFAGILNTLTDENLTGWEKFSSVMMASLVVVPQLITGFQGLGDTFTTVKKGMQELPDYIIKLATARQAQTIANTAAAASEGAVAIGEKAAGTAAAAATPPTMGLFTAMSMLLGPVLLVGAAIAVVVVAAGALAKAYDADAEASRKAAENASMAAEAAQEAQQAYKDLKDTLDTYDNAVDSMKELTVGTEEYAEALRDANQAAMDLIKNNPELLKHMTGRNSEGLIEFDLTSEQMTQVALAKANTATSVANLSQVQSNEASLKSQRTDTIRSMGLDFWWSPEVTADLLQPFDEIVNLVKYGDITDTVDSISDSQLQSILEIINTKGGLTETDLKGVVGSNESLIATLMETDNKDQLIQLAETTAQLNETNKLLLDESLRNALLNNTDYAALTDAEQNAVATLYGEDFTEEEQKKLREEISKGWYGDKAFGGGNEDSVHSKYAELRGWTVSDDKWGDKAVYVDSEGNEHEVSDDTAREYIINKEYSEKIANNDENLLKNLTSVMPKLTAVGGDFSDSLSTELLGFASGKDLTFDPTKTSTFTIDALTAQIENGDLKERLSNVTAEEWEALGYADADAYIASIQEGINNFNENDRDTARKETLKRVGKAYDSSATLTEGLQSGDITAENIQENEAYQALLGQLNELTQLYPEIEASANVLGETWLVGTQEYYDALEEVQDALHKTQMASLTEEANDKIKDLEKYLEDAKFKTEFVFDDTEFQTKMDDILNAEYAIDVAIHAAAEDEFNEIVSAMDNINTQASLIGDNFVVSADKVRELNNTFPGIIQGMTSLKDGTVQLNAEVVESAIGMAQAEVAADSEATITKLRNQANLLRQKQTTYQEMATAAMILAQGETDSEQTAAEAKAKISENLVKLQGLNDEIQTQTEMENDQATADASNTNAEVVAKNWNSAYQSAANSSYQFAQTAIQNMKAASGQGSATKGNFGVTYSGASGVSSEAKVLEGTQSALEQGEGAQVDWAALAQKYQMLADSAGRSANDIDGMIAQIGATNIELGKTLNGVKSGTGADGKSSGSDKDPDKMDTIENKIDRYHDVNIKLQQISTTLDRLQEQEDKLFGQDLLDNLNQQLATLNNQIDATNEKIQIARGEMAELRSELSTKGVSFNTDGTIANYVAVYQAQLAYVNSLISKYNSMSAEAQESYKEVVEKAQEDFEKFVEDMERYDELIADEIPSLEDEIQDAINEQIEIQIQKFNMEIEIRLDLADATKEWNEFKRNIIDGIKEDDILGTAASKLKDYDIYYKPDDNGIIQADTRHVNEILGELAEMDNGGWSSVYGDNRTQALEDLQTYYQQLMSDMQDLDDLIEEIEDSYLELMDEAQEKFDQQIENFEAIGDQLEHDIKLVQLLRGMNDFADTDTFEVIDKYYQQQNDNYQQQIQFQASQVEFWKAQMDGAEYASDEWEAARENWMSATSELNSMIEASIENLQDKYLNTIDGIFDKLNKGVTNGLGLDYVSEQWDLINKNSDQYLDTINRAYGIQELQNKYLDALDGTDSLSAQQKINELMNQEIKALQDKDKLTEYDLERAEKKYNLMLKQIALEEAQQNKTTLRLKRDSQGNYTYQYVADDDEVGKLQDEIAALYNELYNFDLNKYKENVQQTYDIWEEMQSKVYEIYEDTTLTEEERQRKIALIQEQYGELINGIVEENEVIRLNLQESTYFSLDNLYGDNITNYEAMTNAERELVNQLVGDSIAAYNIMSEEEKAIIADLCGFTLEQFQAMSEEEQRIYLDLLLGYQNMADSEKEILEGQIVPQWDSAMQDMVTTINGEGGFEAVCKEAFDNLDTALDDFKTNVSTTLDNAGVDMKDLKNATDPTVTSVQNLVTAMGDLTDTYEMQLLQCEAIINQLGTLKTAYDNAATAAKNAATEAYNYWAAAQNKAAEQAKQDNAKNNSPAPAPAASPAPAPAPSSPQGNGTVDVGDTVTFTGGYYYESSSGGSRGSRGPGKTVKVTRIQPGAKYPIHVYSTNSAYGWLTQGQLKGYDTGGYTGNWGNGSGRLALLHQKELVLNAKDTENMLAAIEVMRNITASIDTNLLNKMATLNMNSLGFNMNGEPIEQNVHIEATFPNVTNSHEVEDALKNLINTASQRVHSNKK